MAAQGTEHGRLVDIGAEARYEAIRAEPGVRDHWPPWSEAGPETQETYRRLFAHWLTAVDAAREALASEAEQAAAEAAGPEDGLGPHTAEDDKARLKALALQRARDHEDAQLGGQF